MSEHRILKELLSAFSEGAPGRVAVTATAAGTSLDENKLIQFVEPIWVSDSNIIVLPSPMPGKAVILAGAATGGELRSHDPATVNINSADNFPGIAVAVDEMMIAFCESETSWKAFGIGSDGTIRGGGGGVDLTGLSLVPDFWIATDGDDSDAGTELEPWASLSKIGGLTLAADSIVTVRVKAGTYNKTTDTITKSDASGGGANGLNAHLNIVYEPLTVMDGTAANAITPTNGHEFSGANRWTTTVFGNGLEVNNYAEATASSPNGFGNRNTHELTVYDAHCTNCDDGFSAHDSSKMYLYDCTAQDCEKSPWSNVQTSYVEAHRCTFTTRAITGNVGIESGTPTVKWFNCVVIPGNANTSVNGLSADRCQFGTLEQRVGCTIGTVRDSFVNVYNDGNAPLNLQRCYGKLSVRVRNFPAITQTVNRCVISGPATGQVAVVLSNSNFGDAQNIVFTSNIFETVSAAAFMSIDADNAGYLVGSDSQFFNNILSGSAAFDADLIAADTGGTVIVDNVTADALIGAANTLDPADYGYATGSPAISAGVGGVNCGFAIGEILAPQS